MARSAGQKFGVIFRSKKYPRVISRFKNYPLIFVHPRTRVGAHPLTRTFEISHKWRDLLERCRHVRAFPLITATDDDASVASDKLDGAIEIGVEIGEPPHKVYYEWKMGRLAGVYKDGNRLIGSKSALRRAHRNRARTGK